MLVHNQLTMNTGFDENLLNIELQDITDIKMADYGFELKDDPADINLEPETKQIICPKCGKIVKVIRSRA